MKERKSLEYLVLDVFSETSYKGNPLAVVFTNGNLETGEYQNISREFGYSETSFVYYAPGQKALDVRSFSPTGVEVSAGGGHNLLGAVCAALVKGMNIFKDQDDINQFVVMKDTRISLITHFNELTQTAVVQVRQKPAVIKQTIPVDKVAKALGISTDDITINSLLPTIVQTEVAHAMIPVKDQVILNACKPDNNQLIDISKNYDFEGFYCFTFSDQGQENIVESRFFNPLIGIDEDAATGTAAGPLAGFLEKYNYIKLNKEYKILQGVKLNQPSLIEVMVRENDILVGGASSITMRGEIYL
jgi:PhzF family phenazine biosynthesis protein